MAKVKMTKEQVLRLHAGLSKSRLTGHRFTYAVTKNKESLAPEVKAIRESLKPLEKYKDYEERIQELNEKFANKDKKGNPVRFDLGQGRFAYDIPGANSSESEYSKAVDKVKKEFKDIIDKQEKKIEEDKKFLQEESTVDIMKISLKIVPEDAPQEVMDGLFFMIKEPTEADME